MKKEQLALVILIILYLATRIFHLTILPIFNDEAIYIYWAKFIAVTNAHWFINLTDGKPPLMIWAMVIFLKLFPVSWYLFAGRFPSVITGLISMLGIYLFSDFLFHSKKTALITALFYIFCPFALFYDRMAEFDSFLSSMILWAVYFSLLASQSLSKKYGMLWGFFLGIAFLVKVNALLFLFLTPICFLLCISPKNIIRQRRTIFIVLVIVLTISQILRYSLIVSHGYHEYAIKSLGLVLPLTTFIQHPFILFPGNIVHYISWFSIYVTLPVFSLGMVGFILLLKKRHIGIVLLLLWSFPILITSFLSLLTLPRYILYVLPYFLIAAGYAAAHLPKKRTWKVILIGILIFPIIFDAMLLIYPPLAPLPDTDTAQYITGYTSGYGLERIFTYLHHISKKKHITIITLGSFSLYPEAFKLEFWGNPKVTVTSLWPIENNSLKRITSLSKTNQVFIVMKYRSYQYHTDFLKELHLHEILRADKPNSNKPILLTVPN